MKTGIAIMVLSVVAATTLVTATEAPFVERQVLGLNVRLVASPPFGTTNLQDWVFLGELSSVFDGFELVDPAAPNHLPVLPRADHPPSGPTARRLEL